jgi:hypothetical protein
MAANARGPSKCGAGGTSGAPSSRLRRSACSAPGEREALRAFRLANTLVPEGCELGPWLRGLGLFSRTRLPGHPDEWSRVEVPWLEPSVASYRRADLERVSIETCCAPARDEPRVDWTPAPPDDRATWRELVSSLHPHLRAEGVEVGVLTRPWNVHPAGSPVVATDRSLSGDFAIIDLAPRQ